MTTTPHHLFDVYGVEIETMIVDAETLDVLPIADELLRAAAGGGADGPWVEDVEFGVVGWSNELVAHVVEMKNVAPSAGLADLLEPFEASAREVSRLLAARGAAPLPTGMHPWMQPARETRLWPHESAPIYRAYDALFDCRRHGWANLQSTHLNLPFADDAEFARLMAATRVLLPILPALAASSPFCEGRTAAALDQRLVAYRDNATRVPAMAGRVVPEQVFDERGYRQRVLAPIAAELRAIDADPLLVAREWSNARGAIARFDRMAIEVRVLDAQECPRADLAVAAAVAAATRALVEERWCPLSIQRGVADAPLIELLERCVVVGPRAELPPGYPELFGAPAAVRTAGALWRHLVERTFDGPPALARHVALVLDQGTLAERLRRAVGDGDGGEVDRARLHEVYRELVRCFGEGRAFGA